MKKQIMDLTVAAVEQLNSRFFLMRFQADDELPETVPGQFVEVRIDESPATMLRRPISIHDVDHGQRLLSLLVAAVGEGTRWLTRRRVGDVVNMVLPLGNGWSLPTVPSVQGESDDHPLLVGGGVGIAPLLYYGRWLREHGVKPAFLLGARTKAELVELEAYRALGPVYLTTEDGSEGEQGFVTQHSVLQQERFSRIATCGPKPMMVAVARYAREAGIDCEASLENLMACGLGACLCCVEKTTDGNLCVCKEGPVFNTKRLLWLT